MVGDSTFPVVDDNLALLYWRLGVCGVDDRVDVALGAELDTFIKLATTPRSVNRPVVRVSITEAVDSPCSALLCGSVVCQVCH